MKKNTRAKNNNSCDAWLTAALNYPMILNIDSCPLKDNGKQSILYKKQQMSRIYLVQKKRVHVGGREEAIEDLEGQVRKLA